jgi:uncharacterized membrane protein
VVSRSIEINRSPADVFAYLNEVDKQCEWQGALVSSRVNGEGPVGVGTRITDTRNVPGGAREMTYEITEYEPPRKTSWRGIDGPVRAVGTAVVEPLDDGARSRVSLELDLQGHGIGMLIAPFARRQAGKQVPIDQAKLKEILERG